MSTGVAQQHHKLSQILSMMDGKDLEEVNAISEDAGLRHVLLAMK